MVVGYRGDVFVVKSWLITPLHYRCTKHSMFKCFTWKKRTDPVLPTRPDLIPACKKSAIIYLLKYPAQLTQTEQVLLEQVLPCIYDARRRNLKTCSLNTIVFDADGVMIDILCDAGYSVIETVGRSVTVTWK